MKVSILGASGFIGRCLVKELMEENYSLNLLSRQLVKNEQKINNELITYLKYPNDLEKSIEESDIIINFIGENIALKRWSKKRKEALINSRIKSTELIKELLEKEKSKQPKLWINTSAIGYYGSQLENEQEAMNEFSIVKRNKEDFLQNLCFDWEKATNINKDKNPNIKVIIIRLGTVFSKKEGALAKIVAPFKWFLGGSLGNGKQIISWISIEDVVKSIVFLMKNQVKIEDKVINLVAPFSISMKELCKHISEVMNKPNLVKIPAIMLKLLLGEMSVIVLKGNDIKPKNLEELGYTFKDPEIKEYLEKTLK